MHNDPELVPHKNILNGFDSLEKFTAAFLRTELGHNTPVAMTTLLTVRRVWDGLVRLFPDGFPADPTAMTGKFDEIAKAIGQTPLVASALTFMPMAGSYIKCDKERDLMAKAVEALASLAMASFPADEPFPDERVIQFLKGMHNIMEKLSKVVTHPLLAEQKESEEIDEFEVKTDEDGNVTNWNDIPKDMHEQVKKALKDAKQTGGPFGISGSKIELKLDATKPETWEAALDSIADKVPQKVRDAMLAKLRAEYAAGTIEPGDHMAIEHTSKKFEIQKKQVPNPFEINLGNQRPGLN